MDSLDPRWNTNYEYAYTGPLFQERKDRLFFLPASVNERWCRPGYQPERPNKGIALLINANAYHQNQYGPSWQRASYTSKYPMLTNLS